MYMHMQVQIYAYILKSGKETKPYLQQKELQRVLNELQNIQKGVMSLYEKSKKGVIFHCEKNNHGD